MKQKILIALLSFITMTTPLTYAATQTNSFQAIVTLSPSCSISTANVAFGNYNPTATDHQTSSQNVKILCTKGTPWNMYQYAVYYPYAGLSDSTGYASAMLYNGNRLYYQVQMSDGVWDNDVDMGGRPNLGHFVGNGTGQMQEVVLNFRVLKNQYVATGNYVDNTTVYLEF